MNQVRQFARDAIKNIIPLDDESIDEMVQYAIQSFKTREGISNHFLDILGPTEDTFQFVSKFCDMLFGSPKSVKKSPDMAAALSTPSSTPSSNMAPVSNLTKSKPSVKQISNSGNNKSKSNGIRLVKNKVVTASKDSNSKGRMANNSKNGATTSQMFDMTPTNIESQKVKKKEVKKKLENIQELDDVLLELELLDSKEPSNDIRKCNCNATRHPLFEMYPNCLNCGKIICVKEGLQPCSFCGTPLMSSEEKLALKDILTKEKEELEEEKDKKKQKEASNKSKKKNVIKVTLNTPGQNNFKIQEQLHKQIEESWKQEREQAKANKERDEEIDRTRKDMEYYNSIHKKDPELIKAEERLAMLLSFQDNGAERTKIIDHAADFDLPMERGNLWASPMERALQLKRQQKQHKKLEEQEKQRSGRGSTVVEMSIKNGQAVFNDRDDEAGAFENLSDDEEVSELQKKVNSEKLKKFKQEVQNVYDYDSFNKTFHKPVYHKQSDGKNKENEDENRMISQLPELGKVVQLGDAEEQEDQLFTMIGV